MGGGRPRRRRVQGDRGWGWGWWGPLPAGRGASGGAGPRRRPLAATLGLGARRGAAPGRWVGGTPFPAPPRHRSGAAVPVTGPLR